MTYYNYYMTMRPPMPGAQPTMGLVNIVDLGGEYISHIEHRAYARLEYNRPLTEKEIDDYELVPDLKPMVVQYRGYKLEFLPFKRFERCRITDTSAGAMGGVVGYAESIEEAMLEIDESIR